MSHSNRKADGQGRRAQVVLPAFVSRSEDAEDQLEGEEELNGHRLPRRRLVVQLEGEKKTCLRDGEVWGTGLEMRGKPKSRRTKKDTGNRWDFWHQYEEEENFPR